MKLFIGTILFMLAIAFGVGTLLHISEDYNQSIPTFVAALPAAPPISKTSGAPAFGHPMVPGGIHTHEEMESYRALYSLADGYVFLKTSISSFAYVSYMKNGQVYWTKHPRFIPAGEPIISDGNTIILQRCGNMLRFTTPAPVETLFDEPDDLYPPDAVPGDLAAPVAPVIEPLETADFVPPDAPSLPAPSVISDSMPSYVSLGVPLTVVSTEEPSSGACLVVAVIVLAFALAFEESRRRFL